MKVCVIVVPYYRENLSEDERLSLDTLQKMNRKMGLDIIYIKPISNIKKDDKNVIGFPDEYFKSFLTYSDLILTYSFWDRFRDYEYMLIYQLDCLIFRPNILEWCDRGWDYIGAPWTGDSKEEGDTLTSVGNGGFSLRKISKVLEIFDLLYLRGKIPYPGAEDIFFSRDVFRYIPFLSYKVASITEAKYFSWECNISLMRKECKEVMPTGCHAWARREKEFFRNLIK